MMSGQRLADIIYYPVNIYYGISGYTDAISFPASTRPVVSAAVFLVIFLAYFACTGIKHFSLQKVCCVCVLAILSLVNFKHGFIRNGYGHTVDVYLLQWFLFIYILHVMGRSVIKNVLITACTMSLFVLGAEDYPYFFKGAQIRDAINGLQAKTGDAYRLFSEEQNGRDYRHHINSIRSAFPLPALKGTSDIYNFDQAVLIASDNIWNPRPAFQSYQAVTPYLANINYEHLLKKETAPDNIFFRVETIDGRFPSLDDGISWKGFLSLYEPTGWTKKGGFLILKRNDASRELALRDTRTVDGRLGREIFNPYENGYVFLKLNLRKSFLGRLISVVYKTDPVRIRIRLKNGQERMFRIIPLMSESGFLLSPLIENAQAFCNLYETDYFDKSGSGSRVRSLTIIPDSPYQYSDSFSVTFEQLDIRSIKHK